MRSSPKSLLDGNGLMVLIILNLIYTYDVCLSLEVPVHQFMALTQKGWFLYVGGVQRAFDAFS